MEAKFNIVFEDNTIFKGTSYPKSNWGDIPDLKIKVLEFFIDDLVYILKGFKQYNHFKEERMLIGGKTNTSSILLMGRRELDTLIIKIDLKIGRIEQKIVPYGTEYGKQILSGWVDGIFDNPELKTGRIKK